MQAESPVDSPIPGLPKGKHAIAMVCDFFYPRLGGVEMHIWSLSQCLIRLGHKVVVITGTYPSSTDKRVGVRYMTNGLKVYYMPVVAMVDQATLPTYFAFFPLFRAILVRERITVVHGHTATSPLIHDSILQAKIMGYKAMFTDHSLFGFADAASINVNKYLKLTLSNVDHCICVSNTDRENLVLRAHLDPRTVSAIPNAVDASKFTPQPDARPDDGRINIVMLSRLVYRKGIDLVVDVIPAICERYPHVHFVIGGDGPKKLLLEEMRERHQLHDRVELLGAVAHKNVRDVLTRGHIFLNCSLTEAFCIAILEAACCGCFVVSTKVGGVPEVLPERMIQFAEATPDDLIDAIEKALPKALTVDPQSFHEELRESYNWLDVARRTAIVYDSVAAAPPLPLIEQFRRYFGVGRILGPVVCILVCILHTMWRALEALVPAQDIDVALDVPYAEVGAICATPELLKQEYAAVSRHADRSASQSSPPAPPPPLPQQRSAAPDAESVAEQQRQAGSTSNDAPQGGARGSSGAAGVIPGPASDGARQLSATGQDFSSSAGGSDLSGPANRVCPPPRLRITTIVAAHSGPDGTVQATPTYFAGDLSARGGASWGGGSPTIYGGASTRQLDVPARGSGTVTDRGDGAPSQAATGSTS